MRVGTRTVSQSARPMLPERDRRNVGSPRTTLKHMLWVHSACAALRVALLTGVREAGNRHGVAPTTIPAALPLPFPASPAGLASPSSTSPSFAVPAATSPALASSFWGSPGYPGQEELASRRAPALSRSLLQSEWRFRITARAVGAGDTAPRQPMIATRPCAWAPATASSTAPTSITSGATLSVLSSPPTRSATTWTLPSASRVATNRIRPSGTGCVDPSHRRHPPIPAAQRPRSACPIIRAGHPVSRAGHQVDRAGHQVDRAGHQVGRAGHRVSRAGHPVGHPEHLARPRSVPHKPNLLRNSLLP